MTHRTFRSLDQPPRLLGFTIAQWAALIADALLVGGLVYAVRLPAKPAITLLVFLVGLPAALLYAAEAGGPDLARLLADLISWRATPRLLPQAGQSLRRREQRLGELIPGVRSVGPDGLTVRHDGCLLSYLQVSPVNPLVMEDAQAERVSAGFAQVAARLDPGQALQLYTAAVPVDETELLAAEARRCRQARAAAGDPARAGALAGLGELTAASLRDVCAQQRPLCLRFVVVCPWQPGGGRGRRRDGREPDLAGALRHTEGVAADLEAAGLTVTVLDGAAVLDLLGERLDPDRGEHLAPPAGSSPEAQRDPKRLRGVPVRVAADHLLVGRRPERCLFVSLAPEQTWLGWVAHLMQSPWPFAVSVHLSATDRYRERMLQRRRYRRVYGVNRGVEARGRMLDADARLHEQDALELNDALAASAGGVYRMGIYAALTEPAGDPRSLAEGAAAAARELTLACEARVGHGRFAQLALWRSTLPLGEDPARRARKYVAANVGDSFPLIASTVSSPAGIPLGVGFPGRGIVRVDPFDPVHPNHLLLINGMSGAGKTMSAVVLLARAISHGATGSIIDRAGHFEFLASLIPCAGIVALGAQQPDAINCWEVPDAGSVGPEKIDYLLALHALLLGEHHQGRDSYGLSDLEANLLGLAIAAVYERCARSGERPRELLLREELDRRYVEERTEGSLGIAEALRNLSMRLSNYVDDGPYAYLTDRQTTIDPGAPLVVFDTRSIPDAKAAAALFVICEHVKSRIQQRRAGHLEGAGPVHEWAGRSFLVIDEAWKLIERPATGRWFNEFCRRSRHYALWLIAISQQLSDFENEHGRALLANAAMRLFLRQEPRELSYVREALGLSEQSLRAIGELDTVKGSHADAYLMNGTRGEGNVRITLAPGEYWLASSDPARDEPIRRAALRKAGGDPWRALRLLAERDARRGREAA